jgi:hypothetical protein
VIGFVQNFKLTIVQETDVAIDCGTGGGVAIGGWVKPTSNSIHFAVDVGTLTGNSLNMFKEAPPTFGAAMTMRVPRNWVYIGMHWDSGCNIQGFYRSNNADLETFTGGTSLVFTSVFSIQGTTPGTYNLVTTISTISPSLRNSNFLYGPVYVLEYQTLTPASNDNVIQELAFGPSFMSSIDFLWKYDQFQDFEDQTAFKARIYDGTDEKSYMEDGNFNSYGVLIKASETMRFVEYNSSVYDIRTYFRVDTTDFPTSVPLTKPTEMNVTDSDGDTELVIHPLPDNLVYLSNYLFTPQTMNSRLST